MEQQQILDIASPDLTLEQRELMQAWLSIIKRTVAKKPVEERPGFLLWAERKAKKELTPGNYQYFLGQLEKAKSKAAKALDLHIRAERSANGL